MTTVKGLVSSGHEVEHRQHVRGRSTRLLAEAFLLLNRLMVSPATLTLSGASSVLGDVV